MQRRIFIKKALSGIQSSFFIPTLLTSACTNKALPTPQNGKKVMVIGAGISGLAAAKKLAASGVAVTVLEAQNKIGGRLQTNRSLGFAFDEGASWIHGIKGNPITMLATEAGMTTAFTDDDSRKAYDVGGKVWNATTYDKTETELYSESLKNNGNASQSFESVFKTYYPAYANDRLWQYFLSTYLTFDTGDLGMLSSTLYDEGEVFAGGDYLSTNGYDTLIQYLANGLSIQLNQRVSHIDYSTAKLQVTHNGQVSEADYVLITVPLGVLKANAITFSPTLPLPKQAAIQNVGMGCVNKFLLTWNTAFWDDVQYIAYTPATTDKFNYFLNLKKVNPSVNALVTYAYAEAARQTESMSDADITSEIMTYLKDIYGNNIPSPTHMLRTKWQSNSNTYGSYSYTAVKTEMSHFDTLAESVNNTVFFAGEHTHIDYFSTVHGAYLSGLREADKILQR